MLGRTGSPARAGAWRGRRPQVLRAVRAGCVRVGTREAGRGAREDAREQQWRQVGQEGERPRGGDELSVCSEPPGGQCGWGLGRILEMEQTVFADGSGVGNVT